MAAGANAFSSTSCTFCPVDTCCAFWLRLILSLWAMTHTSFRFRSIVYTTISLILLIFIPCKYTASSTRVAFVGRVANTPSTVAQHGIGCPCAGCTSSSSPFSFTRLFADAVSEDVESADADDAEVGDEPVPDEVAVLDGVESSEEAHNVDRPARQQLKKKKGNQGMALSEFVVGSTVKGTVKSITSYGAFIDIGATTDGLLHVSQLSTEFVSDVGEVLAEKQEVDVRIIKIDTDKNQVGLSLMTAEEQVASDEAQQERQTSNRQNRRQQAGGGGGGGRRDDNSVLSSLKEKGWDASAMVEGTVVSTVDFGCFVRVDASALNSECEGEFDGLVHVSAMSTERVNRVTDVISVNDKVQVRCRSIDGTKVSLTMLSVDDEETKNESSGPSPGAVEGARDWKEILVKMDDDMPAFQNLAVVEDRRK
jgi:predicted RNA-binding protein with RPS1 domain